MQFALSLDGHCSGPLFAPPVKVRAPKRSRFRSGGAEVWAKYKRARPPWVRQHEVLGFWGLSRRMTDTTGVQHSVDHIVPLVHPLVCGLHCPANLRVAPLAENIRKSNNWWPDMWGVQGDLLEVNL
jgi:hypothetical protein